MSYELRSHTADVAVEANGETVDAVFGAVADGMAAAMCDDVPAAGGDRFALSVSAETGQATLFDYLDELIYERDVRGVLPVDNQAVVTRGDDEWTVEASARGVALDQVTARDLKAVTYSEMALERSDGAWRAYVVFDV